MTVRDTAVLIIGAGAAGLRVAIELRAAGIECLVVTDRRHDDAHTRMAAGGINAVLGSLDPDDRWEIHAADTIREGGFVCQPRAVEILTREAPDRIHELEAWGCDFDRTDDGRIDQRYFGAQSFRRTCFVGDATGEAILSTLIRRAEALDVPFLERVSITTILTVGGVASGAAGFDLVRGEPVCIRAPWTVLAAGGCTSLYRRSSSRQGENIGDAVALAYDAGAELQDMEFIQFHPTGMIEPEAMRGRLVTEAVRGEGGRLFNAAGERFMERYAPEQMELAARDVVARANYAEIQAGRGTAAGGVLLDISHVDGDRIRERLPRIHSQFREQGVDITTEPMEVAPTAHYPMGGVRTDVETGATRVSGLLVVGEADSGVHGANRLGGNSLAETVVFGRRTGAFIRQRIEQDGPDEPRVDRRSAEEHLARIDQQLAGRDPHPDPALLQQLQTVMWEHAGIIRSGDGLRSGMDALTMLAADAGRPGTPNRVLVAAEAILRSALLRAESRGAHYREDHPTTREGAPENVLCFKGDDGRMRLRTRLVPEIPPRIRQALDEHHTLDYHHLE